MAYTVIVMLAECTCVVLVRAWRFVCRIARQWLRRNMGSLLCADPGDPPAAPEILIVWSGCFPGVETGLDSPR